MRGRDGRYAQGSPCIHKAYGREAQKRKKDAYYSQRAELLRLHSLQGRLPGGIDPFRHFRNNGPEDTWDDRSFETRMWRMIFFSDLCLRPYCYACPYAALISRRISQWEILGNRRLPAGIRRWKAKRGRGFGRIIRSTDLILQKSKRFLRRQDSTPQGASFHPRDNMLYSLSVTTAPA